MSCRSWFLLRSFATYQYCRMHKYIQKNCCAISHKVYCRPDDNDESDNKDVVKRRKGRKVERTTTTANPTTVVTAAANVKLSALPSVHRQVESTYRR